MEDNFGKSAIILLSGGIDSTTVAAIVNSNYASDKVHALTINYNQRHVRELESAGAVASHYGWDHKIITLNLAQFGGSALTDPNIAVPQDGLQSGIPVTYVPGRNTIFFSLALAYAEVRDADYIYSGVNAIDYSGYPDCRPEYIRELNRLAKLSSKRAVEGNPISIKAPLIHLTKVQIIQKGISLSTPYNLTWSCYNGGDKACGKCDSCRIRNSAFQEIGIRDPIDYEL